MLKIRLKMSLIVLKRYRFQRKYPVFIQVLLFYSLNCVCIIEKKMIYEGEKHRTTLSCCMSVVCTGVHFGFKVFYKRICLANHDILFIHENAVL